MIKVVGKPDFTGDCKCQKVFLENDSILMDCIINQIITPTKIDILMISENLDRDVRQFENQFKVVEAAGGWVFDKNGRLLMIQRGGFWDIPKGHLEKNEKIEDCAIREVEEETMVKGLKLGNYLGQSNHIYQENGIFCIKKTYWYMMTTTSPDRLTPQLEEGITRVEWVEKNKINSYLDNSWRSIREFYIDSVKNIN